jgi:hypothetical protein
MNSTRLELRLISRIQSGCGQSPESSLTIGLSSKLPVGISSLRVSPGSPHLSHLGDFTGALSIR